MEYIEFFLSAENLPKTSIFRYIIHRFITHLIITRILYSNIEPFAIVYVQNRKDTPLLLVGTTVILLHMNNNLHCIIDDLITGSFC
jgi:hypothetical protein